jgi:hypothetical protein|tara:strand:+ start:361 stop:660 length:300 start_codon:yes stop_codon:yes gene_type:complete
MTKSRTFKKDEPPIPFHYKFYLIYWEDIQSDSGWRDLKDIQESKPAICVSTGWLVKKDKKVHILMSDYNYDEKGNMADGGNTTVIPTKNVIRKYEIEGL